MEISGLILAGGKNSRMGRNKAFLKWGEQPLVVRTAGVLRQVCNEIIVVANDARPYANLGLTVTGDLIPGRGPLSGIHAGLRAAQNTYAFVVACDMPFLQAGLVVSLAAHAPGFDVVVPRTASGLEPLHAIYSKSCLSAIEQCLAENERSVKAFYDRVRVRYVDAKDLGGFALDGSAFYNVNTSEDLTYARKMAGEAGNAGEKRRSTGAASSIGSRAFRHRQDHIAGETAGRT